MKKLTKRNRKSDQKVVFGYHVECRPEQRSNYTTTFKVTGTWPFRTVTKTCTYVGSGCCNP